MTTLPTKAERQKLATQAKQKKREYEVAQDNKLKQKEKDAKAVFKALCHTEYKRTLDGIQAAVERGEDKHFIGWCNSFRYSLQRDDVPESRNFDKMRKLIANRIKRNFPEYHAEPGRRYYTANNMSDCYENGCKYEEWQEYTEGIKITWDN